MNALEIKDLRKNYSDFSLDGLNLTLPTGCIMGLVGENGAGKSTTIKLILNMIHKDSGTISIFSKDHQQYDRNIKEDIGFVLDEVGFPGTFYWKDIHKVMSRTYKNWDEPLFLKYMKQFHLPENKKFFEYSKGMKMRLGLAVALSHHAKLLILDEATNGLDPVVRDEVLHILSEFTRDESHSILISSHIVSDLEKLCDYIAFLHQGRMMLCEEKDILCERYGMLRCTSQQLNQIEPSAIIGKKENAYGTEAIVRRDRIPTSFTISPVSLEELFVFMVRKDVSL